MTNKDTEVKEKKILNPHCPACGWKKIIMNYDNIFGEIKMECNRCSYKWEVKALNKKK